MERDVQQILLSEEQIQNKVNEFAAILSKEYADKDGLDFLYVVKTTAEAMLKVIR